MLGIQRGIPRSPGYGHAAALQVFQRRSQISKVLEEVYGHGAVLQAAQSVTPLTTESYPFSRSVASSAVEALRVSSQTASALALTRASRIHCGSDSDSRMSFDFGGGLGILPPKQSSAPLSSAPKNQV